MSRLVALGPSKSITITKEENSNGPQWTITDPLYEWSAEELAFAAIFLQTYAMERVNRGVGWPEFFTDARRGELGLPPAGKT